MKKRIIALLLCLSMLLSLFIGSVVANNEDYSTNVGKYARLSETNYGIPVGNFTDIAAGNDVFLLYEEFEPGTIFQITDWYLDTASSALWYEVSIYSGGPIPEAQEYWPAKPWILQDYLGESAEGDSLVFLDTCDICGKPDCDGIHESTEDTAKVYLNGAEVTGGFDMPKYDQPTLSADTTLTGAVSYQWQILADSGRGLWVDIAGEDNAELTLRYGMVASLLDSSSQAQVRCITTANGVDAVSDAITVTVEPYVAPILEPQAIPTPNELSTKPSVPVTEPSVPAEEPSAPAEEPTVPAEEPSVPAEEPSVPAEEPSAPAEEPSAPAEEPSAPAEEPSAPAEEPSAPAEEPSAPAEMPAAEPLAPAPAQMPAEPVAAAVSPAAAEPPAEAPAETPAEAPVEAPAAEHAAIAPENTAALYSSEEPDDPASQDAPSIYTVTVYYVFFDTGLTAAEPKSMNVGADGVMQASITFPTVQGYLPYVMNNGKLEYATFYHPEKVGSDVELTVYYQPTDVEYTVEIYQQNVSDDAYTLVDKKTYQAKTGSLVPQFAELPENDSNRISYPGFYPLLNEMPTVAADGSTVVELKFDRDYYLMNFDLNGGYGVEPIYARYGTPITVGTPIRIGYQFQGWTPTIPKTVPAQNTTYTANWTQDQTAKVTVVFWGENANYEGEKTYSYITSGFVDATVGSSYTFSENGTFYTCGQNEHIHTDACKYLCGKDPHTHDSQCYSCGYENHTHTRSCYTVTGGTLAQDPTANLNNPTNYANDIYYRRSGNRTYYYLKIGNNYYQISFTGNQSIGRFTYSTTCQKTEHTHSNSCSLSCGKTEHTHSDACGISCGKEEHTHNNGCSSQVGLDSKLWEFDYSQTVTVNADGTSVVNVYYDRTRFTITFYRSTNTSDSYKIYTIYEKWGTDISKHWPIKGTNGTTYDDGQRWTPVGSSTYTQVLVYLAVMPQESFKMTLSTSSADTFIMHYMVEALPGTTENVQTYNGKTFVEAFVVSANYNHITKAEDFFDLEGFTQWTSNPAFNNSGTLDIDGGGHVYFYYTRHSYAIEFYNPTDLIRKTTGVPNGINLADYDFEPDPSDAPAIYEPGSVVFDGWYLSPECSGNEFLLDKNTMPAGIEDGDTSLVLYAKWVPKKYDIETYLNVGDTVLYHTISDAVHGEIVPEDKRPLTPTNGDYQFVGWFYKDANGTECAFDFANMPIKGDITLYAKWSSNVLKEYTIHFVLEDGTPIAPPVTGSALAGRTKTFDAKGGTDLYAGYQEGYYPLVKSHSIVLDIADDSKNVYSFVYEYREDPVPYTVYYLTKDENGNPVELGSKENNDNRKAVVVENYKPFPHYMPDQFQQTLVVSLTEPEKNYIEFWYTPDTVHAFYTFEYYLQDIPADGAAQPTYTLSTQHSYGNAVEIVGNEVKTFTIPEIDIEGFTLDKTAPGTVTTGTLDAVGDTLDLRLYYKRNQYPYQIQYLEYGTGKKLAEPVTYTGNSCPYYGEYVTAGDSQVADVPGYTLHSVRGCTIRVEASQTNPARNFVYVYYVPINGNLKISKTIDNRSNMALDPDLLFEFVITVPEAVTGTYPVSLDDVPQGSVTVSPEHTLSLSVKDGQSVTISGLPVGYPNPYTYHISETPVPGFQGIFSPGQDVVLENKQTKTVACTNVYPVCDLVLTKTVKKEYEPDTWDRVDDAFRFFIYSPALVNGRAYTIAGQQCWVSNHTLTLDSISVSAPDVPVSLTIHNLPIGEYTVTEKMGDAVKDVYITTANGVEGSVANVTLSTDNLSDTAEFVNTFKRTTGSLTVTKKITIRDGFELDPDDDAEFTFAVIMPEDLAERHYTNISYTVTGHSTIRSVTPDGNRTFTFALKNGESLTIEGLPVGSYIVKEYPSEGYASSFPKPNADGTVQASVTVETGKTTRLDCVNTFPVHVGNLDLSKTVRNESGLSVKLTDTFSFQIAFKDSGEEVTYPVTYRTYDENGTVANSRTGTLTASKTGENVVLTVALKDGEHAVIERIPEGTCTITETPLPKYTTANNGVTTVTITPDQTLPVTVENVYEPSTLTIVKSGAEAGQVFVYEVTDGNGKVTTVTITGNGSTVIHDLAPGFYTVTQKNNWSWRYTDAPQTVTVPKGNATVTFSGGIPNDKSSWLDGNSGLITNRRGG